ncbi:MAG: hypothetical protein K6E30_02230 [Lachnospiraceae bacterium]|nr:hypothetical protein [Lachnospiraceae bacterium]
MYTSDMNENKNRALRTAAIYLGVSLFTALFGAIYERFSHEVYSYFMIYAFAFPLAGGVLPFFLLGTVKTKRYPNTVLRYLFHAGIATLTVGSIMKGVLDIYGTTNSLTNFYWFAGIPMVILPVFIFSLPEKKAEEKRNEAALSWT